MTDLGAVLAEIRDRNIDAYADGSTSDLPRLIRAVEAVLDAAAFWEQEQRLLPTSYTAEVFREAVTRALTEET